MNEIMRTTVEAYSEMSQEQRDEYNALVARLDDMLVERKSKERRKEAMCIAFPERRINERRHEGWDG